VTETHPAIAALGLPPVWPESFLSGIDARNRAGDARIVVLDDDPLGGQCVYDVPVLTSWRVDLLAREIESSPAFLLLTNTRALSHNDAIERATAVGRALREAEQATGRTVTPIWRSDSTLRGHFHHEMQAFEAAFRPRRGAEPVYVFLPYFGDGGRYTIDDTQQVLHDGALVPAAETEFARDPAFAYAHSHLPSWLEAHSRGRFPASEVRSVTLADVRTGGPDRVAAVLRDTPDGGAVIVNAAADRDLEVFVAGLQAVQAEGRRFLCSGAASFVRVRLGQEVRALLSSEDLGFGEASQHAGKPRHGTGGLTIVGSYVDKSHDQLTMALTHEGLVAYEIAAPLTHAVPALPQGVTELLLAGRDVIVYTPRTLIPGTAQAFAEALTRLVAGLRVRPRYLMVKGGSTASRLATEALGVRRAVVLGRLMPGVPVWRLGEESRWPGLPFVIFPGNVGTSESLREALGLLRGD
jgi:uncharacterized protein YgbK (DUF1537 family)